ncbi:MAG: DUF3987 domain-containing protein [Rhodomicrobium sp.]
MEQEIAPAGEVVPNFNLGVVADSLASKDKFAPNCGPYAQNWRAYVDVGYSPTPERPGTKRPAISGWSNYCDRPPTEEEAARWAGLYPSAGIALALGFNDLVAVDIDADNPEIIAAVVSVLPTGAPAKVGRRGVTCFFRGDVPTTTLKAKGGEPGKTGKPIVEILGYGRKTTIPPSVHPDTGKPYEWIDGKGLLDIPFDELPEIQADIVERLEAELRPWLAEKPSWSEEERSYETRPAGNGFTDPERKRYENYAGKVLEGRTNELASRGKDSGRNNAVFSAACYLGKFEVHGVLPKGEIERQLIAACEKNGLLKEDGRASVFATIRSGFTRAKNDPLPVLPDRPYPAPEAKLSAPAKGSWNQPEPLASKVEPQPYPVDALPVPVREAVEEAQSIIMAPVALVSGCVLSAMATAIQGLVDVERMNGLIGPVSLFLLTLAMSGDRKSTADKLFTAAIRQYEREQEEILSPVLAAFRADLQAWEQEGNGIREAIKRAARDGSSKKGRSIVELQNDLRVHEAKKPREPRVPQLIRGDDTSENLAWALARKWPSAAIISSEAGIVFGGHAMGPDAIMRNLALQNTLWDGGEHKVGRRTSESFTVRGARLVIGLQVQEEALRNFCEKNGSLARGMGYFARFLFAWPASMQGQREITGEPSQTQPAIAAFNRRMASLLEMPVSFDDTGALSPALLRLTPDGKAAWIELHNGIERLLKPDGDLRDIRDVASKAADNIARLAAIFHVYEHGVTGEIGADSVRAAGQIVVWHLNEARRFLGEFSMPKELAAAARLESWLIAYCKKSSTNIVPRREVQHSGPYGLRDGKTLDMAVKELQELGRVREVKNGQRREIHINPAVLRGGSE